MVSASACQWNGKEPVLEVSLQSRADVFISMNLEPPHPFDLSERPKLL